MSRFYQTQPTGNQQYDTYQTGASNVSQQQQQQQQQRQPIPQAPLASTSPQVFPPGNDYSEQVYPSYHGDPQAQQGYHNAATGYLNPTFPEPLPPPAGDSFQRSHSGQPASHYLAASGSAQRGHSGQSEIPYSSTSGSVQRSRSGRSEALYTPTTSSVQRSHSGQSTTAYHPAQQTFDSTNASYTGLQPTPQNVPGHGTNASGGSRSGNHHSYPATPSVTRATYDPPYRGTQHPQERGAGHSHPQQRGDYEYDNEGHMDEHRPKSPGRSPAQGRQYYCRMPGCNQPMFFDRRFNEFWEWCSIQHIQMALGQRMEKHCKHCGVWPRKYSYKYCGGSSCNKQGVPISTY